MSSNPFNIDLSNSKTHIPNHVPHTSSNLRLAIIGWCPCEEDLVSLKPFSGPKNYLLSQALAALHIPKSQVMLGYVAQVLRPTETDVLFGLNQLQRDLADFRPNVILTLGKEVFRYVHPAGNSKAKGFNPVATWRGSILQGILTDSPFFSYKIIPTFSPTEVIRQWDYKPLFIFDLKRAWEESSTPELNLPQRTYDINLSVPQIIDRLDMIRRDRQLIALDIEGGVEQMTCISIATSPYYAFIIPFSELSESELLTLTPALARMLGDKDVPKVLQNQLYDNFVLSYAYKMFIANVQHDTMLSGWELYCELPKGLGMQTSIWTREPYYKFERKVHDKDTHYIYCCKDSCVTYEIHLKHMEAMSPEQRSHYEFNMKLLNPLLYMELKGFNYDVEAAKQALDVTQARVQEIRARLVARAWDGFNPASPAQVCKLLYTKMGFPPQHPKGEGNRKDTTKLTSNVDAILELLKKFQDPVLNDLLALRKLEKLATQLSIKHDPDGRVRCSYILVGTETGRLACKESPTRSGMNLQTVTKKLRHLYCADEEYWLAQCDLAGADGWTVAAHCARYGDKTMLDDYLAGLKPAKIIALLYNHGLEVNQWDRDKLRQASKGINEEGSDGWKYFACKRVQHGTNYGLGTTTMSGQILKDSYKIMGVPIYLNKNDCQVLQRLYLARYPGIQAWHRAIQKQLETAGTLTTSFGYTRRFFGRAKDNKTFQEALAHEPQANTTYVTNCAMLKLWSDPENRRPDGSLVIQPLHSVHDALIPQFPQEISSWAKIKIHEYFQNPIDIAGTMINIPYDGGYGRSWGELTETM